MGSIVLTQLRQSLFQRHSWSSYCDPRRLRRPWNVSFEESPLPQHTNSAYIIFSGTGDAEEGSKKTGNAGGRVACGVIEVVGGADQA